MSYSNSKEQTIVSVFIPVYNGEKYLRESIEMILRQELPAGWTLELLITDSGSKDSGVSIVESFDDPRIVFDTIPNTEFGHGKTRDRAARRAHGKYIVFITQDATPATSRWLINMIEPFYLSDQVGCVFGRQIPRPYSVPTIKREVASVFGGLGASDAITIHRDKSLIDGVVTNPLNTFFSDANSAVRCDLLVGEVPFRDLPYAEDQALAEDMQKMGYLKAYSALGAVLHSNEYSPSEYYHRKFDEYTALKSLGIADTSSLKSLLMGWIRPTIADYKFIRVDSEYNRRAKIKFLLISPAYNFCLQLGKYQALKYFGNASKAKKLSLESREKQK